MNSPHEWIDWTKGIKKRWEYSLWWGRCASGSPRASRWRPESPAQPPSRHRYPWGWWASRWGRAGQIGGGTQPGAGGQGSPVCGAEPPAAPGCLAAAPAAKPRPAPPDLQTPLAPNTQQSAASHAAMFLWAHPAHKNTKKKSISWIPLEKFAMEFFWLVSLKNIFFIPFPVNLGHLKRELINWIFQICADWGNIKQIFKAQRRKKHDVLLLFRKS